MTTETFIGEWWKWVEVREDGNVRIDVFKNDSLVRKGREYREDDVLAIYPDLVILRDNPKKARKASTRKPYEALRGSRW